MTEKTSNNDPPLAAGPEQSRVESLHRTQDAADRAELHTLLLQMSNLFIRAEQTQINRAIDAALATLGDFAGVSSCYLFEFDAAMESASKCFEWLAPEVPPTLAAFTGVTGDSMRTLFPRAAAGRILRVDDLSALEEHERKQMEAVGVGAFLCVPVRVQGRVVGLLGFDQRDGGRVWNDAQELLLLLAADMFAQALDRRQTHNRLAFHVDNAPLGVVEWDRQWRVQRWSPKAEQMFGWGAGEVMGQEWASWPFVHEDDIDAVQGVSDRLISGAESSNVSVNRNYTKDGRTLTCEWFNSVLRDASGELISILSFVQDITERQRVQQELAESREALQNLNAKLEDRVELRTAELNQVTRASEQQARTLQAILDGGLDHVVLLDRQTRCVYVGRAVLEDLNRPASVLVGRTAAEADLPAAMSQMLTDQAGVVLREGRSCRHELILDTVRGRRSFEYTLLPVFDEAGRPAQVLCSGHDITERLRAAAALRESEVRHRTLAEHATDMISCHDAEGRFTYVSPACRRLLGYEPAELIGQRPRSIAHPDDREDVIQSLVRLRQTTEVVSTTFRALRKDGRTRWLESSSRNDGQEIVVVSRDVTERLDTEQRLRLIRSAVDQVRDAVIITDNMLNRPGPRIVYVNPAFTQMTGYGLDEIVGRTPRILQGPRTNPALIETLREALNRGDPFVGETTNYRKDGSEYDVEWSITPLRDNRGHTSHWVAIQRDITDRKNSEQMARIHREELAHVGRLSVMGEMASGLAHEINQPLAAINNYASGVLRRIDRQNASPQDVVEALRRVAEQSDRAGQIIRRIRGFVMKRGTLRASEQVNDLIKETLALLDADITERRARVGLDLAADLPPVYVDGIQIEQVLLNLIRNGLEAMDANAPEDRRLEITTGLGASRDMVVAITDHGPGLSESERDHLFDPFFSTKDQGMGMGLTISQSIVQAHGGRLWATPGEPGGTTFSPLAAPGRWADKRRRPRGQPICPRRRGGRGKNGSWFSLNSPLEGGVGGGCRTLETLRKLGTPTRPPPQGGAVKTKNVELFQTDPLPNNEPAIKTLCNRGDRRIMTQVGAFRDISHHRTRRSLFS